MTTSTIEYMSMFKKFISFTKGKIWFADTFQRMDRTNMVQIQDNNSQRLVFIRQFSKNAVIYIIYIVYNIMYLYELQYDVIPILFDYFYISTYTDTIHAPTKIKPVKFTSIVDALEYVRMQACKKGKAVYYIPKIGTYDISCVFDTLINLHMWNIKQCDIKTLQHAMSDNECYITPVFITKSIVQIVVISKSRICGVGSIVHPKNIKLFKNMTFVIRKKVNSLTSLAGHLLFTKNIPLGLYDHTFIKKMVIQKQLESPLDNY